MCEGTGPFRAAKPPGKVLYLPGGSGLLAPEKHRDPDSEPALHPLDFGIDSVIGQVGDEDHTVQINQCKHREGVRGGYYNEVTRTALA